MPEAVQAAMYADRCISRMVTWISSARLLEIATVHVAVVPLMVSCGRIESDRAVADADNGEEMMRIIANSSAIFFIKITSLLCFYY